MTLTDLHPAWVGAGGEGVSQPSDRPCGPCGGAGCAACHGTGKEYEPAPRREGVGLAFDCPCGCGERVYVGFDNPLDGGPTFTDAGPKWCRRGDTFETLTLTPSIQRVDIGCSGRCRWHGFVTNGAIESCG